MATLKRTLSLGSVVLFGIAYMTPIIVLGTFGILAETTGGRYPQPTSLLPSPCSLPP